MASFWKMHANNTEGTIFRILLIVQSFCLANISGTIKSKVAINSVNQTFREACDLTGAICLTLSF